MTGTGHQTFAYGECEPPEGKGGCQPPVRVGNATSCTRNPIAVGGLAREVFLVRGGGLAVAYGSGAIDVGPGRQAVSVRASEPEVLGAALRAALAKATELPPDEVRMRLRIAGTRRPLLRHRQATGR